MRAPDRIEGLDLSAITDPLGFREAVAAMAAVQYDLRVSLDDRVERVLEIVGRYSSASRASLWSLDPTGERLRRRYYWTADPADEGNMIMFYAVDGWMSDRADLERHRHHVWVAEDLSTAGPATRMAIIDRDLAAIMVVPLADATGNLGVVSIQWKDDIGDTEGTADLVKVVSRFMISALTQRADVDERLILNHLIDQAGEVVATGTPEGRLTFLNPAGRRLMGIGEDGGVLDIDWRSVIHPDDLASIEHQATESLRAAGTWRGPARVVGADGVRSMIMNAHVVRDGDGGALAITAILHDVTELENARAHLERTIRDRDRFVATVSHELRTPLTGVIGFADALLTAGGGLAPEERRDVLSIIRSEATEMADIVEDLLAFSRLDTNSLAVAQQPIELGGVVRGVAERSFPDVAVLGEAKAMGDPGRVRQILRNLLTNAVRYGGQHVSISVGRTGRLATVAVVDDGEGIPPEHAARIFEPFERAGRQQTEVGMGLGMFVSRSLAQLMGGDLVYERTDGSTVFRLSLPAVD